MAVVGLALLLSVCFLHALAHGQAGGLSTIGLSCPYFIVSSLFSDNTPHPTLAIAWFPKHHLFYKYLSSTCDVPSTTLGRRDRTRNTSCLLRNSDIPLCTLHCTILSCINPGHLISLLPLLISCLNNISKCVCGGEGGLDRNIL